MSRILLCFLLTVLCATAKLEAQIDTSRIDTSRTVPVNIHPVKIDSSFIRDSINAALWLDSFSRKPIVKDSGWKFNADIPVFHQVLRHNQYYSFGRDAVVRQSTLKEYKDKDILFYALVGLVFIFALLRLAFDKYFSDLFRLFFRTTLKQRQIREQLMQTPLPSLMLNAFFVITAGLYIDLMLVHFKLVSDSMFWLYFLYCAVGLSIMYSVKYIGLKVLGWIFNVPDAADSYLFVVFVINKVLGVFLVPFVVALAFTEGTPYTLALVLSWFGIAVLFVYRLILTYGALRNQVKFNLFHFFLYLCAFEIAPLLLIYKLLLVFFK